MTINLIYALRTMNHTHHSPLGFVIVLQLVNHSPIFLVKLPVRIKVSTYHTGWLIQPKRKKEKSKLCVSMGYDANPTEALLKDRWLLYCYCLRPFSEIKKNTSLIKHLPWLLFKDTDHMMRLDMSLITEAKLNLNPGNRYLCIQLWSLSLRWGDLIY